MPYWVTGGLYKLINESQSMLLIVLGFCSVSSLSSYFFKFDCAVVVYLAVWLYALVNYWLTVQAYQWKSINVINTSAFCSLSSLSSFIFLIWLYCWCLYALQYGCKDGGTIVSWPTLLINLTSISTSNDSSTLIKELQMGIFSISQKEIGAKSVAMATTQKVSFCFFCDLHFWCQVSRSLVQYF